MTITLFVLAADTAPKSRSADLASEIPFPLGLLVLATRPRSIDSVLLSDLVGCVPPIGSAIPTRSFQPLAILCLVELTFTLSDIWPCPHLGSGITLRVPEATLGLLIL